MFVNYADVLQPDVNWYNGALNCNRVISWWSGGVASAYAGLLTLEQYSNVQFIMTDTNIEHPDTYRFKRDFEEYTGHKVHSVSSAKYNNPEHVWVRYTGLNYAHGAPCSSELKREVRKKTQKLDTDYAQVFGFDFCKKEINRAKNMVKNYPEINPKFPLIEQEVTREDIFKLIPIRPPVTYTTFNNNNCIGDPLSPQGGCVQGSIGYWQMIREMYPHKFRRMADWEHYFSYLKGVPVTLCKDQRKLTKGNRLFLRFNPMFPEVGTIDLIKGRQPVGMLRECNGFCSTEEIQ